MSQITPDKNAPPLYSGMNHADALRLLRDRYIRKTEYRELLTRVANRLDGLSS